MLVFRKNLVYILNGCFPEKIKRSYGEVEAIDSRIILEMFGEINGNYDLSIAIKGQDCTTSVCNFQSMKSPVEMISFLKILFLYHQVWLDATLDVLQTKPLRKIHASVYKKGYSFMWNSLEFPSFLILQHRYYLFLALMNNINVNRNLLTLLTKNN